MYEIGYGVTGPHPDCWENLTTALAATVTTAFNVFMMVEVGPDGRLTIQPPISTAG